MFVERERTNITYANLNKIRREIWTTEDILDFLNRGAVYRTFRDILRAVYHGPNLEKTLTENMCRISGKNYDSMAKNVKNWLRGSTVPQRKQLFQICFALALDEKQADKVISSASETGIHYRDPEEIIYAYGLYKGKSWEETEELCKELLPACTEQMKNFSRDRKALSRACKVSTRTIEEDFFENVDSDEELEKFLNRYSPVLGRLHLTAYKDFINMMDLLRMPEDESQKFSVEKIVDEYLKMDVPDNTSKRNKTAKKDYSPLQKVIKKNWPSDNIIMKMVNRNYDVSRKVMLLLFLVTEEFEAGTSASHLRKKDSTDWETDFFDDMIADFEDFEADELLEMRIDQINLFLGSYGMNRLDPCNAFDCLFLYALKASYDSEASDRMDSRMKTILKEIFQ